MVVKEYGYAKWHSVGVLLSGYKIGKLSRHGESKSEINLYKR